MTGMIKLMEMSMMMNIVMMINIVKVMDNSDSNDSGDHKCNNLMTVISIILPSASLLNKIINTQK